MTTPNKPKTAKELYDQSREYQIGGNRVSLNELLQNFNDRLDQLRNQLDNWQHNGEVVDKRLAKLDTRLQAQHQASSTAFADMERRLAKLEQEPHGYSILSDVHQVSQRVEKLESLHPKTMTAEQLDTAIVRLAQKVGAAPTPEPEKRCRDCQLWDRHNCHCFEPSSSLPYTAPGVFTPDPVSAPEPNCRACGHPKSNHLFDSWQRHEAEAAHLARLTPEPKVDLTEAIQCIKLASTLIGPMYQGMDVCGKMHDYLNKALTILQRAQTKGSDK